jgi:hypothetical protein
MRLLALIVLLISATAWAGDKGANVTHEGGGHRIVNGTWDRYIDGGRDWNGGVNQSFGERDGPRAGVRHDTGRGSYLSEDGEVPKYGGPAFEGAC